ncbi:MAG: SDR family oxidoreductase [Ignavibacteria bacterium]|nr:SDR family oxidoreductase [Ignavibacteria bacterium]
MSDALFSLSGRVAVVTGATGLLGKQHCRALAGAGAGVVAADLDEDTCRRFAEELESEYHVPCTGYAVDITQREETVRLNRAILKKFGRVDVLINNAAINDMFENPAAAAEQSRFEEFPLSLWQRSLDVNVTGTFLCCQAIGSSMARAGSGSIINIASTYGIVAPDQSLYRKPDGTQDFHKSAAYPVTKGAVLSLTRFLAAYWGKAGVRVNSLSPGGVENSQEGYFLERYSERTPLGRMAQPTDYQGAVIYLASDASLYMTGANLVVDGGWTIW